MAGRRLTIAMRDLWLLAAAAVDVDVPHARELADHAFTASGPDRYTTLMDWMGVRFAACDVLPRGWVFYATDGRWQHLVLVHPQGQEFVLEPAGLRIFVDALQAAGPGLMPMAPLLVEMLMSSLTVPDTYPGPTS